MRAFWTGCKVGLWIVILAWMLGGLILAPVPSGPYMLQPYYEVTRSNLSKALAEARLVSGPVEVGFGRVRITPTLGVQVAEPAQGRFPVVPLAGYGSRQGQSAVGVHDDLFIKTLALRVGTQCVVWLSGDWLIVPPRVRDWMREELARRGLARGVKLYWGATHTHSGLGGWGQGLVAERFTGRWDAGVCDWLARCALQAVLDALTDLQPARVGLAHFEAPEFIRNRLVGEKGEIDAGFDLMVARQDRGRLGVVGVYGAHATVLDASVQVLSGDYPGAWQRVVEAGTGGVALFMAGAVGSQAPQAGAIGFEGVQRMGRALGDRTLEILRFLPLEAETSLGWVSLEVQMPPLCWRVSDQWRLRPWLAAALLRARPRVELQAVRVKRSLWCATPCDFSGELALRLKGAMSARGYQAVITSFNGDYVGYVIPSKYASMRGYEPRTMSFYGPWVGDYFEECMRRLAVGLVSGRVEGLQRDAATGR
ncbi:MAG: hypothetical protein RMN51_03020 [Verrucomicrobiota bacterium]|nr:hypothetical protein [Limisphaera sp.]MDW8381071.1 hypothetical protein [Verrucomicrobiota bacterium]